LIGNFEQIGEKIMKKFKIYYLILAVILLITYIGCSNTRDHIVVGKWKRERISLSFYTDGTASFMGSKCVWSPVNENTVKVELGENNEIMLMEFSVKVENGVSIGTFDLWGQGLTFQKVIEKGS
jgi:hypothetical protein